MKRMCSMFLLLSACGASLGTVVKDTTIALKDAVCLLDTYSTDKQAGKSDAEAIADAAIKCAVTQDVAGQFLSAHVAAEQREARKAP